MLQAIWGRSGKQQEEYNSPNLGATFRLSLYVFQLKLKTQFQHNSNYFDHVAHTKSWQSLACKMNLPYWPLRGRPEGREWRTMKNWCGQRHGKLQALCMACARLQRPYESIIIQIIVSLDSCPCNSDTRTILLKLGIYWDRLKGGHQVAWMLQTKPGRSGKQQQEQNSPRFSRALYIREKFVAA